MGSNEERLIPVTHRRILGGAAFLTLLGSVVLLLLTQSSRSFAIHSQQERLPARVERTEACAAGSAALGLAQQRGVACHVVLVELLEGPNTGQLVALNPLFSPIALDVLTNQASISPFDNDVQIDVRASIDGGNSVYNFAEQERTSALFVLIALGCASALLAGHRFGLRVVITACASVAIVVLYALPTLSDVAGASVSGTGVAILSGLGVLGIILIADGPYRSESQAAYLTSSIAVLASVFVGVAALAFVNVGAPVSAGYVALNPIGAAFNVEALVLVAITIGAVLPIASSARAHIDAALQHRSLSPSASTGDLFFASLSEARKQSAAAIGVFVLASVAGSLPLLVLFTSNGPAASQALNNELLAAIATRIAASTIGIALVGIIAAGLSAVLYPRLVIADRTGELHQPRPPLRREPVAASDAVIDLSQIEEESEQPLTRRLRVGVDEL